MKKIDYNKIAQNYSKYRGSDLGVLRNIFEKSRIDSNSKILEVGCGTGNYISKIYDSISCECYGVDYSEDNIAYGQSRGLNIYHGGIEILEDLNKKADLIILSHVFEHFTDLRKELERIRNLLTADGYLYIEVPGLYQWSNDILFQNAHNWQFNTRTLTYVMNACGWEGIYYLE